MPPEPHHPRTLLGHPICQRNTAYFYPDKLDSHQFLSELKNATIHFEEAIKTHVNCGFPSHHQVPRYLERWVEHFFQWMQVTVDRKSDATHGTDDVVVDTSGLYAEPAEPVNERKSERLERLGLAQSTS